MPRYFIEVAYKGTNYSGFQIQENANSIQAEVEKAMNIFFKFPSFSGEKLGVRLTGSSRTDAGVHALQNFFHFDVDEDLNFKNDFKYNLNALLPLDIAIKKICKVTDDAHCRFDALSREYKYFIYQKKNPFLQDTAYYYPYQISIDKLNEAAAIIIKYDNFISFSKTNTQVKNFICSIKKSEWNLENEQIIYTVVANRFLRGMVKALVGTMLQVGRGKMTIKKFKELIQNKSSSQADFSPPSHGLFLMSVSFNDDTFCS